MSHDLLVFACIHVVICGVALGIAMKLWESDIRE